MNRNLVPALIATLSLAATAAWAQTSAVPATATTTTNATVKQPMVVTRLETTFSAFAGSTDNAESLIMGLRNGTPVTLTDSSGNTSTFTPATKKMGWGNVKIALALAQAQLTKAGITNPTSADIQTALNGGTITNSDGSTTKMTGILTQRASGMGWGQIAQAGR